MAEGVPSVILDGNVSGACAAWEERELALLTQCNSGTREDGGVIIGEPCRHYHQVGLTITRNAGGLVQNIYYARCLQCCIEL